MKLSLQSTITSPQELQAMTLEVRRYAKWLSHNTVKTRVAGEQPHEPLMISEAAGILIKEAASAGPLDLRSLDELIKALEALEKTSKRMTITLAAPPPSFVKKALIVWSRENIDENILIDFRFDSTLLGGMVVQYGSHVHDWSFRRQILAARQRFPEILRHV